MPHQAEVGRRVCAVLLRLGLLAGFAFCGWLLVGGAAAYADDAPPPIDLSGAAARALRLAAEIDRTTPASQQLVGKLTTGVVDTVLGSPLPAVPQLVDSVTAVLGKNAKPAPAPKPPAYERPVRQSPVSGPAKSWLGERPYEPLIQRPFPRPAQQNAATDIPAPPPVPSVPDGPLCPAPIGASAPTLSPNGPVAVTESALHLLPASTCRQAVASDRPSPAAATRPVVSPD